MLTLAEAGAAILPASPGLYHRPQEHRRPGRLRRAEGPGPAGRRRRSRAAVVLSFARSIRDTLSMIRFSHSVFALPFALLALFLAAGGWPAPRVVAWVLVAMVAARSAAMGVNRLADRRIDAANPRTASRQLVTGALSVRFVGLFTLVCALAFVLAAVAAQRGRAAALARGPGGPLRVLLPQALHRARALRRGARAGALAARRLDRRRGGPTRRPAHPARPGGRRAPLGDGLRRDLRVPGRGGGPDAGLHSLPARLGVPRALRVAALLHVLCVLAFAAVAPLAGLGWIYLAAVGLAAALLVVEHALVSPTDLSRVNVAFFTVNGVVALDPGGGRHPRRAAVALSAGARRMPFPWPVAPPAPRPPGRRPRRRVSRRARCRRSSCSRGPSAGFARRVSGSSSSACCRTATPGAVPAPLRRAQSRGPLRRLGRHRRAAERVALRRRQGRRDRQRGRGGGALGGGAQEPDPRTWPRPGWPPVPRAVLVLLTAKPVKGPSPIPAAALVEAGALVVDCRVALRRARRPGSAGAAPYDHELARVDRRADAATSTASASTSRDAHALTRLVGSRPRRARRALSTPGAVRRRAAPTVRREGRPRRAGRHAQRSGLAADRRGGRRATWTAR